MSELGMGQDQGASALSLEARLDRVEAHIAIGDLFYKYAQCVRREKYEDLAALFAVGGTFEVRAGQPDGAQTTVRQRFETPQDLVAFLSLGKGKPHPVPLIHNLMIEVTGDRATANAMLVAAITGTDKTVSGEYHDSFARVNGQWLFADRVCTMFG